MRGGDEGVEGAIVSFCALQGDGRDRIIGIGSWA